MKREMKLAVVATAAALLAGCATGGGGSGGATINGQPATLRQIVGCILTMGLACPNTDQTSGTKSSSSASRDPNYFADPVIPSALSPSAAVDAPPTSFESWSTFPRNTYGEAPGVETRVFYEGRISSVLVYPWNTLWADSGINHFKYDEKGNLVYFSPIADYPTSPPPNLSSIGYPGIDVGFEAALGGSPQSPFTSVAGGDVGVIGNPYALGWDYQAFGAWNSQASGGDGGVVFAQSFGAATPASAVPLSGAASFAGKLGGLYISPAGEGSIAAGDVTVDANFSARTLSFASSNTVATRDLANATPAPNLNLGGMLSYSPGSGGFRGTLTSAGGTLSGESSGQFYGPNAEELGGVFVVKSASTVETFTGAYGAKR